MTGYTQAELIGCVPTELLGGSNVDPESLRSIAAKLAAGEPFEIEALRYTKGGRPFWLVGSTPSRSATMPAGSGSTSPWPRT